jgi:hypothetical protein
LVVRLYGAAAAVVQEEAIPLYLLLWAAVLEENLDLMRPVVVELLEPMAQFLRRVLLALPQLQ